MNIFQMLTYALNPKEGNGILDKWKPWLALAVLAVLGLLEWRGIFDAPNEAYLGLLGALLAFVAFDSGHYDGKQGQGGPQG